MKYVISAERTAEILIERHGRAALDFAARQCASLERAASREGLAEWRVIASAVERLRPAEA